MAYIQGERRIAQYFWYFAVKGLVVIKSKNTHVKSFRRVGEVQKRVKGSLQRVYSHCSERYFKQLLLNKKLQSQFVAQVLGQRVRARQE